MYSDPSCPAGPRYDGDSSVWTVTPTTPLDDEPDGFLLVDCTVCGCEVGRVQDGDHGRAAALYRAHDCR